MRTLLPPLALVLFGSALFDYHLAREAADRAFDHSLADTGLDIASHIQHRGGTQSVELSPEAESMLRSDPSETIFYSVRDADGTLLAGDGDLTAPGLPPADGTQFTDRRFRDQPVRLAVNRIAVAGTTVTIAVAETTSKRELARARSLTAILVSSVAIFLATMLSVYFGVRRGLAPLREVEEQIGLRSPRDLREIDLELAPDEIRPMLARLNQLFRLLHEAAAAQQRFLADAAHQLRTPLTGLQTQIELASIDGLFAGHDKRLAQIEAASGRIAHLVSQLLTHARADPSAGVAPLFEPVALHDLLEQAASSFIDQALAKGIDLGFEIEPAIASGVPWMLREALANLIDNALRYTPADGIITVRSRVRGERGCARIEVEDNGPGIPRGEREQVFARFYRLPGASGDGCGLGLAIVREIADLHGIAITLDDASGGGLIVTLDFPPPAPAPGSVQR